MGYNRAYEALKNERVTQRVRNTPTPQQEKGNEPDQKTQILQLFDKGAHEEFFKAISRQLASNEEEIRKF